MPLDLLKINIQKEKEIMNEINVLSGQLEQFKQTGAGSEVGFVQQSVSSLINQLEIVNRAIPDIVNHIQFYKQLKSDSITSGVKEKSKPIKDLMKVKYDHPVEKNKKVELGIKKKDKLSFLENLSLGKSSAEKLKEKLQKEKKKDEQDKFTINFIKLSNKYFRARAIKLIEKKMFTSLNTDLRKITSPFLLTNYVSMMFLAITIAAIMGILISIPLMIFVNVLFGIFVLFGVPLTTFLLFYSYPSSKRSNLEKEINQELPFITIYLGAVATSGIEPTKIFSILVRTSDYPFTQREIKKLLNYINFYGYDLVSALRYGAKSSPSERLATLFNGLSTNIRSGGSLSGFLEKHAETLLFDYRLEREKYTKIAETFMDIYISIVIAAPMILMILFVLIRLTGYGASYLTPGLLSMLIILIVGGLNIGFLIFLNMKQPKF